MTAGHGVVDGECAHGGFSYRCVTDPSMPNGTGGGPPVPFTLKGRIQQRPPAAGSGQAIRSRTTGAAVKAVPGAAMS
ncbi:hypothetical protein GCM10027162_32480 [Streptomyces incanus]